MPGVVQSCTCRLRIPEISETENAWPTQEKLPFLDGVKTTDYRHTKEKRRNIPPAKMAAEGKVPKVPKAPYYYNPHLPPVLRFDPSGEADGLKELLYEAARRPLRSEEVMKVAEAIEHYGPWLEWAGKREQEEKRFFEVDPVALHIHERVSAQAIVRAAMRERRAAGFVCGSSAALSASYPVL